MTPLGRHWATQPLLVAAGGVLLLLLGLRLATPAGTSADGPGGLGGLARMWVQPAPGTPERVASGALIPPWSAESPARIRAAMRAVLDRLHTQADAAGADGAKPRRLPVMLVPPLTGTRLLAELHDKSDRMSWFCRRCSFDNLRLIRVPPKSGRGPASYTSPRGVNVTHDPSFDAVVRLTPGDDKTALYLFYVEALQALGWRAGQDIDTLPYDWRVGPEQWVAPGQHYDQLKQVIERLSARNGGAPVVLLSVSMGGPFASLFLSRHTTRAWRRKHVARFVSLGGSFGGAAETYGIVLSGTVLSTGKDAASYNRIPPKARRVIADVARSFPSVLWMAPHEVIYKSDQSMHMRSEPSESAPAAADIAIYTPARNYSAREVPAIMLALSDADAAADAASLQRGGFDVVASAPDVELHCLYGIGIPTVKSLRYATDDLRASQPTIAESGDGDGTVPLRSLAACGQWARSPKQGAPIIVRTMPNQTHISIINSPAAIEYFLRHAYAQPLREPEAQQAPSEILDPDGRAGVDTARLEMSNAGDGDSMAWS